MWAHYYKRALPRLRNCILNASGSQVWCIVVSEQIACRFTWNCFLPWILNVSLHSTSWAGDKKEIVVDSRVQWSLISGAAKLGGLHFFVFHFITFLNQHCIDMFAKVYILTGQQQAIFLEHLVWRLASYRKAIRPFGRSDFWMVYPGFVCCLFWMLQHKPNGHGTSLFEKLDEFPLYSTAHWQSSTDMQNVLSFCEPFLSSIL